MAKPNMGKRLKFLPGEQQKFLLKIQAKSGLSIDQLAELAGIVPRSYRDWKRGKLNMAVRAANLFSKRFGVTLPERKKVLIERWEKIKLEASIKGGFSRFRKYGSPGTLEGRRKGGAKALAILRKRGVIPPAKQYKLPKVLSEDLTEFIGILLGDGGITHGQVQVTLNSVADKEYVLFVSELGEKLFGQKPSIYKDKKYNAVTLCYSGVNLVKFLVKLGLKKGNKVKQQVGVPFWIRKSEKYTLACLRGLMDTDGGVFLHRYKVNGKEYVYKKICFSNRSLPILYFVAETLTGLGFTPKVVDKVVNKKLWLYNIREVERYLGLVGTHNPRLLKYQETYLGRVVPNW